MTFWLEVKQQAAKTLQTLDHGKRFEILEVSNHEVLVRNPHDWQRTIDTSQRNRRCLERIKFIGSNLSNADRKLPFALEPCLCRCIIGRTKWRNLHYSSDNTQDAQSLKVIKVSFNWIIVHLLLLVNASRRLG